MHQNRQLAAILFTDIVGYTAMMQQDEQNAVIVTRHYVSVLKQSVAAYQGKILNDYGDGSLCSFSSATEAMRCAIEMQQQLQNTPAVPLRIGLHVGELFFEGSKVMGDGVNVASRIQSLGQANSILFSKEVFDKLKNQPEFKSVSIGRFQFKNVDEPMEVFALTNDGLVVPDKKKMEGKLQEKKSSRKKIILTASLLLLAIILFFVYSRYSNKAGFNGKEKSIAILPFTFIGDSKDALSEGLVEDILALLMKIKELKVISNMSSVKYADTKKSIQQIGEELNVSSILKGSIQQIGNRIKVSAQLIDSKTGDIIWSDVYDFDKIQIFDLQTKLATQIVNALNGTLTSVEKGSLAKRYTENIEAYKLYRKGLYFWNKNSQANFDSAELYYKSALDIDPDYALAYAGLANCYIFSRKVSSQLEAIPIAKMYATKALSIDSNLSEALTTLGWIEGVFDYDWLKSKSTLIKAIKLNPNYGDAHLFYGNLLQYTGENTGQGISEIKKALELDPLDGRFNWVLGRNYFFAKQYEPALEQAKKTLFLNPNFIPAKGLLIALYLEKKMYPQAFELISQFPKTPVLNLGWQDPLLCYAWAISGDTARAKSGLMNTIKKYPDQSPLDLAKVYIALKNYNEALRLLERAYELRELGLYFIKVEPSLDPIRNEPRFKALLKKMNLE